MNLAPHELMQVNSLVNRAARAVSAGRFAEAEGLCREALEHSPDHPHALVNLACAMLKQGKDLDRCRRLLERARELLPNRVEVWMGIAETDAALKRYDDALKAVKTILALAPQSPAALEEAGRIYTLADRLEEAAACYLKALAIEPRKAQNWIALGLVLDKQDKYQAAAAAWRCALALEPQRVELQLRLALQSPSIPESHAEIDTCTNRIVESIKQLSGELSQKRHRSVIDDPYRLFGFTSSRHAYYNVAEREINRSFAELMLQLSPSLSWCAPHLRNRAYGGSIGISTNSRGARKIRVGVGTAFFPHHIVSQLALGLARHLNADEFEVIGLIPPKTPSEQAEIAKPLASLGRQVVYLPQDLKEARRKVAELKLDVFFPLDIYMDPLFYYLSFARLAPVQCTTWGHPLTTGIPNVDYFISARDWETPDSEQLYTERLVSLTNHPMYLVPPPKPHGAPRAAFGLADDAHVYSCPQSLFKLHPDFDRAIGEILARDARAVVVLLQGNSAAWSQKIARRIAKTLKSPELASRIKFVPRCPLELFLDLYRLADVVLDPWHWSGGNTTIEALSVGTPLVTLPGKFMRGKLSLGFLRRLGLEHFMVARDEADYINKCVDFAQNADLRMQVKRLIEERLPALFHDKSGIDELGFFFKDAVQNAASSRV